MLEHTGSTIEAKYNLLARHSEVESVDIVAGN